MLVDGQARLGQVLKVEMRRAMISNASSDAKLVHEQLLHGAAKFGLGAIVVRLQEQQNGADLEERRAEKCAEAAGDVCLVGEGCFGVRNGQPVEEAAGDEDQAADCEGDAYQPGDIPVREHGEHAVYAEQHSLGLGCALESRGERGRLGQDKHMSSWGSQR